MTNSFLNFLLSGISKIQGTIAGVRTDHVTLQTSKEVKARPCTTREVQVGSRLADGRITRQSSW